MTDVRIRPMIASDWEDVRRIYSDGIAAGVTFERECPSWENWDGAHLPLCRYVAAREEGTLGWIALSRTSSRAAYAGVAELSVYVEADARRGGIGKALLARLISETPRQGFWTLQASVLAENEACLQMLKGCGFREVGRRERIARDAAGVWRDTLLLELRLPDEL